MLSSGGAVRWCPVCKGSNVQDWERLTFFVVCASAEDGRVNACKLLRPDLDVEVSVTGSSDVFYYLSPVVSYARRN